MPTHSTGNSVTKTVSMDEAMFTQAEERAKNLGFRSFSAYVQKLIRADLTARGDMVLRETPPPYGKKISSAERRQNDEKFLKILTHPPESPK